MPQFMANPTLVQETRGIFYHWVVTPRVVSHCGCHWTLGWKGISVGLCSWLPTTALHENTRICKLSSICLKFPGTTPLSCIFKSVQAHLADYSQRWLLEEVKRGMPLEGLPGTASMTALQVG